MLIASFASRFNTGWRALELAGELYHCAFSRSKGTVLLKLSNGLYHAVNALADCPTPRLAVVLFGRDKMPARVNIGVYSALKEPKGLRVKEMKALRFIRPLYLDNLCICPFHRVMGLKFQFTESVHVRNKDQIEQPKASVPTKLVNLFSLARVLIVAKSVRPIFIGYMIG